MLIAFLIVAIAYFIGSIPFGLVVGKIGYGKDIRQYGSGNLGATNTFRVLGLLPGIIVLVLDALKGVLAVGLASYLFPNAPTLLQHPQNTNLYHALVVVLTGMAVICGHNWSIYLRFSGGKGIATGAGALLMLVPLIVLILLVVWAVITVITRYVSLASITIALIFPILMIILYSLNLPYILFSLAAASVVIYKHKSNIKRLLAGEESKIGESVDRQGGKV
jgi:glycerol-3-phosphate acyltransferase PlsY